MEYWNFSTEIFILFLPQIDIDNIVKLIVSTDNLQCFDVFALRVDNHCMIRQGSNKLQARICLGGCHQPSPTQSPHLDIAVFSNTPCSLI